MTKYVAQQGISHGADRFEVGAEVPEWLVQKSPWLVTKGFVEAVEVPEPPRLRRGTDEGGDS